MTKEASDAQRAYNDNSTTTATKAPLSAATSDSGFDGVIDESRESTLSTMTTGIPPPATTTRSSNDIHSASLGANVEGLVLYDLTNALTSEAQMTFSPHCVKTILGLRLLNVGYDRQRLTFYQIRTTLAQRIGDDAATVPTLELADGTYLSDSWRIAVYLAAHHPSGVKLFPNGPSSRSFAAALNTWGKTVLAPSLGPLTRPAILDRLQDGESHTYFEEVKCGKQKLDRYRGLSTVERQRHIDGCIAALEIVQAGLSAVVGSSSSGGGASKSWLEGGAEPSHADFCIYAWYAYTRAAGPTLTRQIWHAHPLVARWVADMTTWAGTEITRDFF